MKDARAVLISDVHFHKNTKDLASAALRQALDLAHELNVPLVIAGDLNDTKAQWDGGCQNEILSILSEARVQVYVIVGNHDRLNEKAPAHSLEFLKYLSNVTVVDEMLYSQAIKAYLVPYYHDTEELRADLKEVAKGSTIIMHQGVLGAFMGEYVVDKSSIDPGAFAKYRVISGHYHRRQTIITDGKKHATDFEVGTFNYLGTPYSITHAEAHDGLKGLRVMTDTALEFVPCNLRKHVKIECRVEDLVRDFDHIAPEDKLWLQVKGPASELDKLSKKHIGLKLIGHENYKLDLVPDTSEVMAAEEIENFTDEQLLDKIIDDSEETASGKAYLKTLWREVI